MLMRPHRRVPAWLSRAGLPLALAAVWLAANAPLCGQEAGGPMLRGLAVYGGDREEALPVIVHDKVDSEGKGTGRGFITIQFDVLAPLPPRLKIRFLHCSRDWVPDENMFVQSDAHNLSFALDYVPSPQGVKGYTFRYVNRFPDPHDAVRFDYSGNWLFRVLDEGERAVLGEGRFFVTDRLVNAVMKITDDYRPESVPPMNQIHRVDVTVSLPSEVDGIYYTAVDIYKNRRCSGARRIDMNDRDPYTMVDGIGRGYRLFTATDILPGNEYRILDISNMTRYPNDEVVRPVEGTDQVRLFWRTGPDHNGRAALNRFTGNASDYLQVTFRLQMTDAERRSATAGGREILLAGPFDRWEPREEDRLHFDEAQGLFTVTRLLRRGIYDYQYVTGIWDRQLDSLQAQDWTVLEGNDWRTTNNYTAFVYYRDPRFGGFDRIAAMAQGMSGGMRPGR